MSYRGITLLAVCASLVYLAIVPSAQATSPPVQAVSSPAPVVTSSGPVLAPSTAARPDDGVQAAVVHSWGASTGGDEFNGTAVDRAKWGVYDGAGHDGNGCRCPAQVTEGDGMLTITGLPNGDTGGLAWRHGQTYGRWEARMRVTQDDIREQPYHPVLILWPDSDKWPAGGEIDYAETDAGANSIGAFLHYADRTPNGGQESFTTAVDISQWHNYAVEWTSGHISGYLDGRLWFSTTDAFVQPPGPMHATIQLDDFFTSGALNKALMQVAWIRLYAV